MTLIPEDQLIDLKSVAQSSPALALMRIVNYFYGSSKSLVDSDGASDPRTDRGLGTLGGGFSFGEVKRIIFTKRSSVPIQNGQRFDMASSRPQLLTTTTRIVVAIILTAYVFALAVRDALVHQNSSHLLFVDFFGLNGRWLVAVNVAFYGYMCWLAFCFISRTAGRERLFVVCWFTGVLLWPLAALRPEWSTVEHYVSSVALGVALLAAGSLLFKGRGELDPGSTTEAE